ncbi:MAG: hypothetical protein NXI09_07660 [Bacteroidetes bacterium]|nr:hypothetical protein [Bacteroidota bacterium]
MSIVKWYRDRQIRSLSPNQRKDYPGWTKVKKVALYYEIKPAYEKELKAWQALFEGDSIQVELLAYQDEKRKNLNPSLQRRTLCKDDQNWWSKPQGADFEEFTAPEYEVYIDLCGDENALHEMVSRSVNASLKIGFSPKKEAFMDVSIKCEKSGLSESCRKEVLALLKFINA